MDEDRAFMERAVALARQALADEEGGPFGAVVVRDGEIVGEGRNRVLSSHDPTAHAEVLAIRDACMRLGSHDLGGCIVYSSSEPCPMCLAALYWARVERVVFGADRIAAAEAGFDDAFLYDELALPREERRLTVQFLPSPEARSVVEIWSKRKGRATY